MSKEEKRFREFLARIRKPQKDPLTKFLEEHRDGQPN
jgi:hypothetical protein